MRKWAFLLPVALFSFFLTGCGQLMNIIYPSNALTVDVHVLAATHPDWNQPGSAVTVTASSDTGQTVSQTSSASTFDGVYAHYLVIIAKLSNQRYTLVTSYTSAASAKVYYASPAPEDFYDPTGTELNMIQLPYTSGNLAVNSHSVSLTANID